jgi:hypothetical protein
LGKGGSNSDHTTILKYDAFNERTLSPSQLNEFRLLLLDADSYLERDVARSCRFMPEEAFKIIGSNGKEELIIILSKSCPKIVALDPKDLDIKKGQIMDLSTMGLDAISTLTEEKDRVDPEAFKDFTGDSLLYARELKFRNANLVSEFLVLERLLESRNYEKIRKLQDEHFFGFIDSATITSNEIGQISFLLRADRVFNDRKVLDSLTQKDQVKAITKFVEENVIRISEMPIPATAVDPVPPPNATLDDVARFYLRQIEEIMNKKRLGYKIKDYEDFEKRKNITSRVDQIASRKQFINYLNSLKQ